jgi:parallel beta-helix repeat protein
MIRSSYAWRIATLTLTTLVLTVVLQAFSLTTAQAATINVPTGGSIQAAINAASNGDTIVVAPGTYNENIVIDRKYVTVISSSGAANTIIDGGQRDSTVAISNVPNSGALTARISGFTIRNGRGAPGRGGGFTIVFNADPTIDNNVITSNTANGGNGGGFMINFSSNPLIKNNTISFNTATVSQPAITGYGGGIFVQNKSNAVIYNNTIIHNNGFGGGGGIMVDVESAPTILKNTISTNNTPQIGGGVALFQRANAVVEENVIANNTAGFGGGVYFEMLSYATVRNNSIFGNKALTSQAYPSGKGGGIAIFDSAQPTIIGNLIYDNMSDSGAGGIVISEGANAQLSYNKIYNNTTTGSNFGGGVYIESPLPDKKGYATMRNNQIYGNSAHNASAIYLSINAELNLINNTIVKNSDRIAAPNIAGSVLILQHPSVIANITNNIFALNTRWQIFETGAQANFTNNLVANDGEGMYYNYTTAGVHNAATMNNSGAINAQGTVDGNPGFADSNGNNFMLNNGSPAIDKANGSAPADDFAKRGRPAGAAADIGAYESTSQSLIKTPVYRFYSRAKRTHFYTSSLTERNQVVSGYPYAVWAYENIAYEAFPTQAPNTVPVYRFYSPDGGNHFYTIDMSEMKKPDGSWRYPPNVWSYERIEFYVYPNSYTGVSVQIFRFYSAVLKRHFYTRNVSERDGLISNPGAAQWQYEGVRWKAPA